jgi:hypothetical protein
MMDLRQLNRKRQSTLLGLSLDGSRLDGVVLRRANGSAQRLQSFSATLSLDPLTAAPELVGAEIRNHLAAAGIHERRCVVCVPSRWALTVHTELPAELPEADVASFLQIEAERGFPSDPETLRIAGSRCGSRYALQIGIPGNHLDRLEQVLHAAKLRPVGFSLGITALEPPGPDAGLALAIGDGRVDLQITAAGGVAALRVLDGAVEMESARPVLHADLIAREVRITLGQLPAELRAAVRRLRVFGPRELAQTLADEMDLRLESLGLEAEPILEDASPALSLAARYLTGAGVAFEFYRPRETQWQRALRQYSSGRYRAAVATAAALAVLVGGAFAVQQWQLTRLRSKWKKMEKPVTELGAMQDRIRQYRPWFDDSFRSLSILRQLTLAFPEDGVVSARTVEIRDVNMVSCSGVARDNAALLRTLSQLRSAPEIEELKVDQIRGRTPLQFVFDFRWNEGGRREN